MERTQRVFGHLAAGGGSRLQPRDVASASHFQDSADDVVIVQALRTPICKSRRGGFKDTYADDLLSTVFTALMNDVGISPGQLEDICVGNVNQQGSGAVAARVAQFYSDIPYTVPLSTVNRQCASGLQAVANIAGGIKAGSIDIGIGAGVETLTFNPMGKKTGNIDMNVGRMMTHDLAREVIIPMGMTSENVAEQFGVTREQQDHMALISNQKATAAQKNGWFDAEIVPVRTILKDKDGVEREVVISKDDGVRPGTNMEGLAKLKPAFKPGGCTTAGNASQISDGAAAVLLARRSYAKEHNLPILGVFRLISVVGVPPNIMGVGPAYAIPAVLKKAGMTIDDIDIFEINEAFASQAVYCVEKLGIPMEKVNPKGGAIALGHPLGCTGARMVGTLLHELKRRGGKGYGIVSMCQGTGMGSAAIIEFPG